MIFHGDLHRAIERVRIGCECLVDGAWAPAAVDGAARQEDAAFDAGSASGLEQADRAIDVRTAKALRIIAFTAAIFALDMVEGGMNKAVNAIERGGLIAIQIEDERNEGEVAREKAVIGGWRPLTITS